MANTLTHIFFTKESHEKKRAQKESEPQPPLLEHTFKAASAETDFKWRSRLIYSDSLISSQQQKG